MEFVGDDFAGTFVARYEIIYINLELCWECYYPFDFANWKLFCIFWGVLVPTFVSIFADQNEIN